MAEQSLKEKTAKGVFWGGLSNGVQQLLNLFFGIFLARILDADAYGMVGMLAVFSLIAGSIQESGFTSALVRKKNIVHKEYNAVFWFSIFVGFFLYIVLFFSTPLIARFYDIPELKVLGRVTFLSFLISSFGTAQNAYLFKQLMVKQKAIAIIISLVLAGTVGTTLALLGYSYWALAIQNLVYIASITTCYWIFSPWRPTFTFDFTPIKEMIGFSSKILITNIFNHINNNLFAVLLGKFYSEKEVGYFTQANKWNYMGHTLISGMIGGVAQPVLADVINEKERLSRVFRKMLRFTAFVSFPALFILAFVSKEFIVITITDKWIPSAVILQKLCIWGAFIPIINLFSNLIIASGRSTIFMWNVIVLGIFQLVIMLLLYPYGIHTMIVWYVVINILWLFVWYYFARQLLMISLVMVLKDILPFAFIAMISIAGSYLLTLGISNIYILFVAKTVIAGGIYLLLMKLSNAVVLKESIGYLFKGRKG